jgi:4'-phosphopantetheinyl transferase
MDMSGRRRLSISEQNIDLWLAFYRNIFDERVLANLRLLLSDAERQQEKRFYFADDQRRYLVTRAMVRRVLSRYARIVPTAWVFSRNEYGRPEIANDHEDASGLCFNISHTRGLIALAVSRYRALGVDVENVLAGRVPTGIADRFFSATEAAALAGVPPQQRADRFFEYWTFKESYIKARGMGLSIPLDRFSFHYPHERAVRMTIDPEVGDDASRWSFQQIRPAPEYLLAICAQRLPGRAPVLTVRQLLPAGADEVIEVTLLRSSEGVAAVAPA